MPQSTSTTPQQPTPTQEPLPPVAAAALPVPYFWIATIEKRNGDKVNCHATAQVIPGTHTRADVFRDVIAFLEDRHGEFVCVSFSLEPNELGTPAVTA